MNIVLVIVIIVLAICAVNGYKKGLVEETVSIMALLIGVVAIALLASAIGNYLSKHISNMLIALILFVSLLIVVQIARLIIASLKFITKIPIIHGINKLAGMCIGLVEGVILVWVAFLLFEKFDFGGYAIPMLQQIEQNAFLKWLYQQNYLLKISSFF